MTTRRKRKAQVEEDESVRLMQLLARLVRLSRKSTHWIGGQTGMTSSMISKILNCRVRVQLGYLLLIAGMLGLTPEDFFGLAYPRNKRRANPLVEELLEIEGAPSPEAAAFVVTQEEVDRMAEAAIRRSLQRLFDEPGKPKR